MDYQNQSKIKAKLKQIEESQVMDESWTRIMLI
jgi:hypothetical protein